MHPDDLLEKTGGLYDYFRSLSHRLRYVRVLSGDWSRMLGQCGTTKLGVTGVFLDPPYTTNRGRCYSCDSDISGAVRQWCIENGNDPMLKIVLAGYSDEHGQYMPADWKAYSWKAHGGFANQGQGQGRINTQKETLFLSPNCRPVGQPSLFDFEIEE